MLGPEPPERLLRAFSRHRDARSLDRYSKLRATRDATARTPARTGPWLVPRAPSPDDAEANTAEVPRASARHWWSRAGSNRHRRARPRKPPAEPPSEVGHAVAGRPPPGRAVRLAAPPIRVVAAPLGRMQTDPLDIEERIDPRPVGRPHLGEPEVGEVPVLDVVRDLLAGGLHQLEDEDRPRQPFRRRAADGLGLPRGRGAHPRRPRRSRS